ncbi:hypothetical protein BsWGS_02417 [Bradybaena similaris]
MNVNEVSNKNNLEIPISCTRMYHVVQCPPAHPPPSHVSKLKQSVYYEIKAVGEFGIEVITKLLNDIYNSGYIPDDLLKYIFIELPKKPGEIDCVLHIFSLFGHVNNILMQIILRRIRNKIKPEIGVEQRGFVDRKGMNNAIYILNTSSESMTDMNRDMYMCLTGYMKAFDVVRREEII